MRNIQVIIVFLSVLLIIDAFFEIIAIYMVHNIVIILYAIVFVVG